MARLSREQAEVVVSVVAKALGSEKRGAHTKASMARQCSHAWKRVSGSWVRFTSGNVEQAVRALKGEGWIIMTDPKGRGLRCEGGGRNQTLNALGAMECLGAEKGRIGTRIKTQVAEPSSQIVAKVPQLPADIGMRLLSTMAEQTTKLDEVLSLVKHSTNAPAVSMLLTHDEARCITEMRRKQLNG